MKFRPKILAAAFSAVALSGAAFISGSVDVAAQNASTNWSDRVTRSDMGGHILGNPLAKTRVIEYMSYTCAHCARFESDAKGPLRKLFISKGGTSFEVRNAVRDPVDLTVALLARCGGKESFFSNHTTLLSRQNVWLGKATAANEAVQNSWYEGDFDSRLKKIASDLGLYGEMASLNINKAKVDQCLSDKAAQQAIVAMTKYGNETIKIEGTPSFTVNGSLLKGVHDWKILEQRLSSR